MKTMLAICSRSLSSVSLLSLISLVSLVSLVFLTPASSTPAWAQHADTPADSSPPYPTSPPPAPPALENPVTGILESGQIIVTISATRRYADGPSVNYGYRLGQLIPITLVISADPNVSIDLGVLENQTLTNEGSDFEMVAPPVVTRKELNGKKITVVRLLVRSWKIESVIPFFCQFHYATGLLPDGKTPNWKLATTPDFIITTSPTATDSSKDLLDGDMSEKVTPITWWSKPLEIGGALLLALVPLSVIFRFYVLWRNASKLTRTQKAWRAIDEVYRQRESAGHEFFSQMQLKVISAALREYLEIQSVATTSVHEPLEQFFQTHSNSAELKTLSLSALAKLDRAIYSRSELTSEETAALVDEIARIIPRD